MMLTKRITQTLFSRLQIFPPMCTQIAGLKNFLPPKQPKQIEYPERRKLKVLERTPQYPPGMKAPKMQKRLKYMRGPEAEHNTILLHKQFAIVATRGGRLRHGHFEMIRLTLGRNIDVNRMFAVWRVDPPWQPVTKKGQGHRMGGGKGAIDHYVTPIKAGRVIIEVAGDCEFFEVKRVLTEIADKLPFEAMAVSQGMLDKQKERAQWFEENNINPWTWKYMIQNNMGGCHQWISPVDRFWFNKYL